MTDAHAHLEPELWVDDTAAAIDFYGRAFGAQTEHRVGGASDPDGVAQLRVGAARFWVSGASDAMGRFSPVSIAGATGRVLLVVEDRQTVTDVAVRAGAQLLSAVAREHGWLVGRVRDPFGHEWEIGRPVGAWPPPG